mmetsp:Transcript_14397/g.34036  ORF Transcript_14397/g.34036 Transcript_14397/m.34036 type:complete len:160 (+) Transcript_14397:242-721(+)
MHAPAGSRECFDALVVELLDMMQGRPVCCLTEPCCNVWMAMFLCAFHCLPLAIRKAFRNARHETPGPVRAQELHALEAACCARNEQATNPIRAGTVQTCATCQEGTNELCIAGLACMLARACKWPTGGASRIYICTVIEQQHRTVNVAMEARRAKKGHA